MTKKNKRWSELTTTELAAATKALDDPNYQPPALKPSAKELAQLRRVQAKAAKDRFRVAIALDEDLIAQADQYALAHGITFADLVSGALRQRMGTKSA